MSFQAVAIDVVGNVSDVAETSGRVFGSPPVVSTSDRLSDAENGFLPTGEFPVTIVGDDGDGVGVKQIRLRHEGGNELGAGPYECIARERDGRPWKADCPDSATRAFTIDTRQLAEGRQTFVAEATDRATNMGERRWSITIDRTAPAVPGSEFSAVYSDEVDETDVFWAETTDPPLGDGSPGSGVAGYSYRYQRAGADWSDWLETDTETFAVARSRVGEPINVELRTRDNAGNVSDVTAATVTAEESPNSVGLRFFEDDEDTQIAVDAKSIAAIDDESAPREGVTDEAQLMTLTEAEKSPAGRVALRAAGAEAVAASSGNPLNIIVQCRIGGRNEGVATLLPEYHRESEIAVRTKIDSHCYPTRPSDPLSVKAYTGMTLRVTLCLQVDNDPLFINPSTIKCETGTKKKPSTTSKLKSETTQLCRPGARYYRTTAESKSSSPGFKSAKAKVYTDGHRLPCNEAGAWRRVATRDGESGTILGDALLSPFSADIDRDNLPKGIPNYGSRGGWQAHHIVSADDGRGSTSLDDEASRIQRLAYTCDIPPNSAVNGVWLRGPKLYDGTDGWRDHLSSFGRRRPEHQRIHTTKHFEWVRAHLDTNATTQGTCLSVGGMYGALRRVREIIVAGDAPR